MRRMLAALIAAMTPGFGALVGALVIALVAGMIWRLTNGRMRSPRTPRPADGDGPPPELAGRSDAVVAATVPAATGILTSDQLGYALGERATLVQFSSAFCAPCRATRRILADVAGMTDGVRHIEIDAESRLDLVRQLNVLRTPTVFVLAEDGSIVRRASGQPRKPDVIAAIGVAVGLTKTRSDSY
jgi:thiol-disulfide isomerase/thioredoxin